MAHHTPPADHRPLGAALAIVGALAALHSLRETLGHVRDDRYHRLDAGQGAGHVSYHLAREACTTAGALAASTVGAVRLASGRDAGWAPVALATGGYLAGQWTGRGTAGAFAPSGRALAWHAVTTALLAAGTLAVRPRRTREH